MGVRSLFVFHRDLRVVDNTALLRACHESDEVLLAFIFPPEQIDPARNAYFSHSAVQFMCESLEELARLHIFKGDTTDVMQHIHKHFKFQRVYQNRDYSVYATKRDSDMRSWCSSHDVSFHDFEDYGLFPIEEGMSSSGKPYTVLGQFYKRYLKELYVRKPDTSRLPQSKLYTKRIPQEMNITAIHNLYTKNVAIAQHGGRTNAVDILKSLHQFVNYKDTRDYPALDRGTTKMSAHLKFGTVSIREAYWACVDAFGTRDHPLIRELIFREFYMRIYAHNPDLQRGKAYQHALDTHVPWSYDETTMHAWQTGTTGFPLVDAGMRQLIQTGWCHNRVRMLVASVATKYLLLDWRECARYFYTRLVDADTFSNTAGWGWASSTGVDALLYFRAPFNPFIQSKKFDKDATYIKRYVPELRDVEPRDIHVWYDPKVRAKYAATSSYPAPIVDHKEASARAVRVFKEAHAK